MDKNIYCAYICDNCKKQNNNCVTDIIEQKSHEITTWKCSNFEPTYLVGKSERTRLLYQLFNPKK